SFVADGFVVPEAKSNVAWVDHDTLLVGTNWGAGTLTASGYPFVVKRWQRGTPLSAAQEVHRGAATDVRLSPFTADDVDGRHYVLLNRGETFFEGTTFLMQADGPHQLTLPRKSTIRDAFHGRFIVTLEQAWSIGGHDYPIGSLLAVNIASATTPNPNIELIYT